MKTLTLNLKGEYFDSVKSGYKRYEYRLYNDYWRKRIEDKSFDYVVLLRGYPKVDDLDKRIVRNWRGYEIREITHPYFGKEPVKVFAIKVN